MLLYGCLFAWSPQRLLASQLCESHILRGLSKMLRVDRFQVHGQAIMSNTTELKNVLSGGTHRFDTYS